MRDFFLFCIAVELALIVGVLAQMVNAIRGT